MRYSEISTVNNGNEKYSIAEWGIAYHEAGHAIIGHVLRYVINEVYIVERNGNRGGCNAYLYDDGSLLHAIRFATYGWGGIVGETIGLKEMGVVVDNTILLIHADGDLGAICEVFSPFTSSDEDLELYGDVTHILAHTTLTIPLLREKLDLVAQALVEHKTLDSRQFMEIMNGVEPLSRALGLSPKLLGIVPRSTG